MPEPTQTRKPIQILRCAFSVAIKHILSYHLIGELCLRSEGEHWWPQWEFLPCQELMCSVLYRRLLWVGVCVGGCVAVPRTLGKFIKWPVSLFIKDSRSFDSPNSSSFRSGHCCQSALDENSFNCNATAWRVFYLKKGQDVLWFYTSVWPPSPMKVQYSPGLVVTWFVTFYHIGTLYDAVQISELEAKSVCPDQALS